MKRFFDLPYRSKLLITYLMIVLLTVALITSLVIMSASSHLQQSSTESLYLLTEQALINCVSGNGNRYSKINGFRCFALGHGSRNQDICFHSGCDLVFSYI